LFPFHPLIPPEWGAFHSSQIVILAGSPSKTLCTDSKSFLSSEVFSYFVIFLQAGTVFLILVASFCHGFSLVPFTLKIGSRNFFPSLKRSVYLVGDSNLVSTATNLIFHMNNCYQSFADCSLAVILEVRVCSLFQQQQQG